MVRVKSRWTRGKDEFRVGSEVCWLRSFVHRTDLESLQQTETEHVTY